MPYKLTGITLSPWVKRVRVLLAEKGVEHEVDRYFPAGNPTPEFLAKSPLGKVPLFEHDGLAIADSLAICAYIEKLHPEPVFFPEDAASLAQALWLGQYADSLFANAEGPIFVNRALAPKFGRPVDEQKLAEAEAKLPMYLSYLESQIEGKPFFCGERMNIGDVTIACVMIGLKHAGRLPDAATYPQLADFLARMHARPSFGVLLEEDRLFFESA
jgi:glutathione S-transferase